MDQLLKDIEESCEESKVRTDVDGMAGVYGMAGFVPSDTGILDTVLSTYLDQVYSPLE